ncbi:hypothetical protein ColTof4_14382 [Colletotrichum tofieldiae]|nr:hypothetical protein ColTof3_14794 [Colletotrichum tofieldiae]GKT81959.1 hypothetical protein ColTof4_14382 [Colletotrichum tofieldiae]
MTYTAALPAELCDQIAEGLGIGDVQNVEVMIEMFPRLDLKGVLNKLANVSAYLDTFVGNGSETVKVFLHTQTFLGGSRAAEFFVPGTATSTSDWDLYCTGEDASIVMLMSWLTENGVELVPGNLDLDTYCASSGYYCSGKFKSGGTDCKVQIM